MRVLMANTFHHRRGGDGTYVLALTRGLERAGHEVIPFAMRHPDNLPSPFDRWFVPFTDFRSLDTLGEQLSAAKRLVFNRRAARRMGGLIDRVKPDVLHIHNIHHHLTPSILAPARDRGIPIVWTAHDYELICPSGHLFAKGGPCQACRGHRYHEAVRLRCKRDSLLASGMAALESSLHAAAGVWNQVDRFLCPSRFLADRLIAFGIPRKRVFHLANLVEVPEEEPGVPERRIIYAGRLSEEKGLITLFDAARRLDAPLDVYGTGPLAGKLRRLAAPNTLLHGHIPGPALHRQLARSMIAVVPSIWFENFPYAVIEAQGAGRAVIASDIGGIPEQITHGVDGMLVPPGDPTALALAAQELLDSPDRAAALGLAGRQRVLSQLQPAPHVDAVVEHYRQSAIHE